MLTADHAVFCTGYEHLPQMRSPSHRVTSTWALASRPMKTFPDWMRATIVWEAAEPYLYFRTDVGPDHCGRRGRGCGKHQLGPREAGAEGNSLNTSATHRNSRAKGDDILVVDLHADELPETTAGMGSADILNYQLELASAVRSRRTRQQGQTYRVYIR